MSTRIKPETREITCEGGTKAFVLHKFPAIAGREIVTQYPLSAMPKLGDYKVNEELMLKVMSYVGVPIEGQNEPLMLTTRALVDNHVPDFETLMRVEAAMMEYNCSFFRDGRASGFFDLIARQAKALISQTLTASSPPSSAKD